MLWQVGIPDDVMDEEDDEDDEEEEVTALTSQTQQQQLHNSTKPRVQVHTSPKSPVYYVCNLGECPLTLLHSVAGTFLVVQFTSGIFL